MANAWTPTPYGYSPVYWISVAGLPVIFTERALGLTLPTDIATEDGALVIDDSAEVGVERIDRDRGIGAGLDLTVKLLDTATVRDYMRRWTLSATLTTDLAVGGSTVYVDDTTGWPASGEIHIGTERITYSSKTGTTFVVDSRATAGSLVNAYDVGTTGQIITNRPRFWRGREVVLWATMVSPSGHCSDAAMDGGDSVQLWRGRITSGPDRAPDGFILGCQSIDRLLDAPLAGRISGKVISTDTKVPALPTLTFSLYVGAADGTGAPGGVYEWLISWTPFQGYDPAALISSEQWRTQVEASWTTAAALAGANTDLGSLTHKLHESGVWYAYITIIGAAAVKYVAVTWSPGAGEVAKRSFGSSGMAGDYLQKLWVDGYDDKAPPNTTTFAVAIGIDDGDPADVPATGAVKLTAGDLSCIYTYTLTDTSGAALYLAGLKPRAGQYPLTAAQAFNADAEILAVDEDDTWDALALRCLHSSGTGARSGTYDTLPAGSGYGIDEGAVNAASFVAHIGSIDFNGRAASGGKSFVDMFGGVMALLRKAVVARPDSAGVVKLHVVATGGSTAYLTTITDDDLLSYAGDPVISIKRADAPNSVIIDAGEDGGGLRLVYNDKADIDSRGKVEVTYAIDAIDREALAATAFTATVGGFANDSTLQAIELVVRPSLDLHVGDAAWLTTTHPAVWTWSTDPGQVGYDGPARITGRRLGLKPGVAILTALIDGSTQVNALSPAAEVVAYDHATAPTTIDVSTLYTEHFAQAITEAAGAIRVHHYQPGQVEGVSQWYVISAAVETGGICRLTVDSVSGAPTLGTAKRSTLTLPPTASSTTYQTLFAHAADGSYWG